MQVLRGNKKRELTIALGELPREQTTRADEGSTVTPARLGFNVQNVTPELARQLGQDSTEGVVVTQVDPNSAAYQAGVRRGMVIREVNQQEVSDTQTFRQALEAEQNKRVLLLVQGQQAAMYIIVPLG